MKVPAGKFLTRLWRIRPLRIAVRIYVAYLALCLLVLTPLLNWGTGSLYQEQTGRSLQYDLITLNPFTLAISANNLQDQNPDGSPFWSAQRIYINLSPLHSLIQLAPTLDELALDGIWVHSHKLSDTRWNHEDILQHRAAQQTPEAPNQTETDSSELPALMIKQLRISADSVQFTDSSTSEPFHTRLNELAFELHNFSTQAEEAQTYRLQAQLGEGGELLVRGAISVKNAQTQGELNLEKAALQPVWSLVKNLLNASLQPAQLSLSGQYHLNWQDSLSWSLAQGQLSLTDFALHSAGLSDGATRETNSIGAKRIETNSSEVNLGELKISGISASSDDMQARVSDIQVNGLYLSSWSQGENTGLNRIINSDAFAADSEKGSENGSANDTNNSWVIILDKLAVIDAAIDWRLGELDQHHFKARQLNISATQIDSSGATPMMFQLSTALDENTRIKVAGDLNLASLNGDFATEVSALPTLLAQPLLTPYLKADIVSGELNARADIQLRKAAPTRIKTSGDLSNITLRPRAANEELLRWSKLQWSDLLVEMESQQLDIPLMELSGFDSRFIITQSGKTNLQELFPESSIPAASSAEASTAPEKPWDINLHKLSVIDSSFRFHDESLTPNFVAAVQHFNGTLNGLSSDTSKPAQFSFHGDVDGYAPVNLQGKVQPFLEQPLLDAQLDFENLDLGGFSGYTSTYAGWRIARGLLTANLHYRLNDGLIQGENHIEMDQLRLGERVQSRNAMDIPLRLALALITDENGLATLDIGVKGNANDPSFEIGKVIKQAVRNSLVKIVQSPFKLLGKLVGSKEDLGYLPFNSGSSQLLTTATRKLNSLQQALQKRPELRIELLGSYDRVTDLRGLRVAQVKQLLRENEGLDNNDIKTQNARWQKAVAAQYQHLELADKNATSAEQMYEQWLETINIAPQALTQLATQRSVNAKQFLVQQLKIDPNRVLINSKLDCSQPDSCNRRIVKLDLSDLIQGVSNNKDSNLDTAIR